MSTKILVARLGESGRQNTFLGQNCLELYIGFNPKLFELWTKRIDSAVFFPPATSP